MLSDAVALLHLDYSQEKNREWEPNICCVKGTQI
jgi:hypothetical protein